jgi:ABC-type bacteriocin/lantibiotic exporter with double-glycine peptidase domain
VSIALDRPRLRLRLPAEIRWLFTQIRPLIHYHVASFLCISAGSLLALVTPLILKWVIDTIIPARSGGLLLLAVALTFCAHQGRAILNGFGAYLMLSASQKTALALRMNLLRHLNTLSAEHYESVPVGSVMYPLQEPVDEISYFGSDLLPETLRILLTTGFTLGGMAVLSPLLTSAVVPLVPIFLATRRYYRKRLASNADRIQADRLAVNRFLQEHLASVVPIQLLAQEKRQERMAFRWFAQLARSQQQLYRTGIGFSVFSSVSTVAAVCAVLGYGGLKALGGGLSVGTFVAFYGFVAQLFEPLSGWTELYARAQKAFASIRQVQGALALKPTVTNPSRPVTLTREHHDSGIQFERVTFAYQDGLNILQIPHLEMCPGEHVAIAGENGAGKSTFAKLVARLYDPTQGRVRFCGEDLRNLDLRDLRRAVCYISREPVLFEGTIRTNLRFARRNATGGDLQDALRVVGLSEFMSDGFLSREIGPNGCQLSGGERQRLAIARALLLHPEVLVLDEATSCLDQAAEYLVLSNVREALRMSTLIVISHRPSTFHMFQRVLVLANGRIVSDGPSDLLFALHNASRLSC